MVCEDLPCRGAGLLPQRVGGIHWCFLFSSGFAEGEKKEGDMSTVYFQSFCYWKATKCGLKILGRVTEPRLPPARLEEAQLGPALSCFGAKIRKLLTPPPAQGADVASPARRCCCGPYRLLLPGVK